MYKLPLFVFLFFASLAATAQQESVYQKDLTALFQEIQLTPSYQEQITGQKKQEYEDLYQELKHERIGNSGYDTLYQLSVLLWPLKDNHLGFYETPHAQFTAAMLSDTSLLRRYRATANFKQYPVPVRNCDSLLTALETKPLHSLEGIYHQGGFKIGIFFQRKEKRFIGILLGSNAIWQKGEMVALLYEISPGRYRAVYANLYTKDLSFMKNERYSPGRLYYFASKNKSTPLIGHINPKKPLLELRNIDEQIQYMRLGNFRTSDEALQVSERFYTRIKDSLLAPNLIVDLRNNSGGGFKSSGKYLSLLRRYSSKGKIFVLVNNHTVSNAEQFMVKLKAISGVQTFGETTLGMITYGSNYGNTKTLPSGKYKFYPTDMRDTGNFLQYEEVGVGPDVILDQQTDWIDQLVIRIRQGK